MSKEWETLKPMKIPWENMNAVREFFISGVISRTEVIAALDPNDTGGEALWDLLLDWEQKRRRRTAN